MADDCHEWLLDSVAQFLRCALARPPFAVVPRFMTKRYPNANQGSPPPHSCGMVHPPSLVPPGGGGRRSPWWTAPIQTFIDDHCVYFTGDEEASHHQAAVHEARPSPSDPSIPPHQRAAGVRVTLRASACPAPPALRVGDRADRPQEFRALVDQILEEHLSSMGLAPEQVPPPFSALPPGPPAHRSWQVFSPLPAIPFPPPVGPQFAQACDERANQELHALVCEYILALDDFRGPLPRSPPPPGGGGAPLPQDRCF